MTADTATTTEVRLDVDQALDLADELIRQLAPQIGDETGVNAVMCRWLGVLSPEMLSQVALAVVQVMFVHCLTRTDDVPPDATTFREPEEDSR